MANMGRVGRTVPQQQGWSEHFTDEAFATEWAMGWLRERGFLITVDPTVRHFETPKELRLRIAPEMAEGTFQARLWQGGCPRFKGKFGPAGKRLLQLQASSPLEEWLTRPLSRAGGARKKREEAGS